MKSLGQADLSSNLITVNIYGLPDLEQRKNTAVGQLVKQCSRLYYPSYPNQKSVALLQVGPLMKTMIKGRYDQDLS